MKLVATVIMHDCGEIVADAIASVVNVVDTVLCLDTEPQRNPSIIHARLAAGDKFQVRRVRWQRNFAAARNYAHKLALGLGADWALTIDTDERIDWGDLDLRATLGINTEADVFLMPRGDGQYAKERVFRLPPSGRWVGRTHEAFVTTDGKPRPILPWATFSELDKTPAQLAAKFAHDEEVLQEEILDHPQDARWRYYLGATYKDTGRYQDAARAWGQCVALGGWREEAAWAAYQCAVVLAEHLDNLKGAKNMVGLGLARMLTPELCWYAGYLALRSGEPQEAILWAEHALQVGNRGPERVNFRYSPAWREKPFEVLHYAHAAMGHQIDAEHYLACWQDEKEQRQAVP